jgi:hypothetical protein
MVKVHATSACPSSSQNRKEYIGAFDLQLVLLDGRRALELTRACYVQFRTLHKLGSAVQIMHLSVCKYPGYSQQFPKDATALQVSSAFDLEGTTKELL